MDFFEQIAEWTKANPGKTVGALIGFVTGILIFTIGPLKTIIVAFLVVIGFIIGKSRDDNVSIVDQITGFFRRNRD
ncbi:MAG: DUF2273 domain-containing protein [Spirochaetes bacterium]|nr:DUF2273 domain-containing protein [Spirochaetota bacterium]